LTVGAALDAIGKTPLVRLRSMEPPGGGELWAKWEGANPTGSMKDRMAAGMVAYGEESGALLPGVRVVEYTGGSTGSSLAMVCAARGYRARMVTADCFAIEKIRTMRAFCAEVEVLEYQIVLHCTNTTGLVTQAPELDASDRPFDRFRSEGDGWRATASSRSKMPLRRQLRDGSDGTRTRDLRRDRPAF
jgi:cysteine synthase